jgi:hypothetical protein
MPKAARERVTSPRAGAALVPAPRSVSRTRPSGRDSIVAMYPEMRLGVKGKVAVDVIVCCR